MGPTFSIKLHDTLPSLHSNGHPNPEESPIADLLVPEYVPDIRLMGIKLFFTFEPTRDTPLPILIKETATEDGMLFEDGCESDPDLFEDTMDLEAFDSSTPRHEALFDASSVLEGTSWEDHGFVEDQYYADGYDNTLLYRTDHSSVHLPTPEASMTFNSQQDTSMLDSTDDSSNNLITEPSLNLATAKQLTDVALRTLLGGRQTTFTPNIKVRKPRPKRPLSSIMPLIWSPGFKIVCLPVSHRIDETDISIAGHVGEVCLHKHHLKHPLLPLQNQPTPKPPKETFHHPRKLPCPVCPNAPSPTEPNTPSPRVPNDADHPLRTDRKPPSSTQCY